MEYTIQEKVLIFLDGFINLDYKHKRNIISLYDDIEDFFENFDICLNYLKQNLSFKEENLFKLAKDNGFLDSLIDKYNKSGIVVITENSKIYPKRLKYLDFNPICLYCKGNISLLNSENTFSIVGSRKTMPETLKRVEEYSNVLSTNNVVIITGIAGGVDLSAIKGAISSGNIISVMACGSDFWEADGNCSYLKKIIENGLVISEYPKEVAPKNYLYPIRNRIIAGLGDGTLIASGEYKSGARYTANYSLDYGKEVFAFPYNLGIKSGELPNQLIKDGANLVLGVEDIIEIMNFNISKEQNVNLSEQEILVYNEILNGNTVIDEIISSTNLKIYEIMPILTSLESKKIISCVGSEYSIIKKLKF